MSEGSGTHGLWLGLPPPDSGLCTSAKVGHVDEETELGVYDYRSHDSEADQTGSLMNNCSPDATCVLLGVSLLPRKRDCRPRRKRM